MIGKSGDSGATDMRTCRPCATAAAGSVSPGQMSDSTQSGCWASRTKAATCPRPQSSGRPHRSTIFSAALGYSLQLFQQRLFESPDLSYGKVDLWTDPTEHRRNGQVKRRPPSL